MSTPKLLELGGLTTNRKDMFFRPFHSRQNSNNTLCLGETQKDRESEGLIAWGVNQEEGGDQVLGAASDWRRFPLRALLLCFLLMAYLVNSVSPVLGAPLQVLLARHDGASNQIVVVTNTVPGRSYYLMISRHIVQPVWKVVNPIPVMAQTNYCEFDVTNNFNSGFLRALELDPAVAVTSDQVTTQAWLTSDSWVPATLSCITTNAQTLITLGAWWYGNGSGGGVMPTDSNGTFSAAMNAGYPTGEDPLVVQIGYQASPKVGLHVVTPGVIGGSGDGYFVLVVANGVATDSPLLDAGHARIWHPKVGPNDPNSIQSISVATDGSAARVGDLAVAIIGQDSYGANNQMSLPSGWTSLGVGNDATNNICYRACYKIVATPGTQSITCNWVSTSCFVAEAAIVIFSRQ